MKILFTGSSSFTGYHFIENLIKNGHDVIITFSRGKKYYLKEDNNRSKRVKTLLEKYDCNFNIDFSKKSSLKFIKKIKNIDIFCHHFADTKDYKSNIFNMYSALENNTNLVEELIISLKKRGLKDYIYTGSYFEPKDDFDEDYSSFSPYGLSKNLTGKVIRHYCYYHNIRYKKFIIPNPFGELEDENRLPTIIAKAWQKNIDFEIKHPKYIRDNIPINLLAKSYVNFLEKRNIYYFSPSFYRLSNEHFVKIFSFEMRKRTNLSCSYYLSNAKYEEPMKKVNQEKIKLYQFKLSKKIIWDNLINYYLKV
jgi:UDP-glucose 4-epimerase